MANALQNIGPAAAETAGSTAAENVLDVEARTSAPSLGNLVLIRRAVLVVKRALLLVAQNFVGLVQLLELCLVATGIGVMLAGELAKRLLISSAVAVRGTPSVL